ncbi:bifunctional folylpolyglutamate synthase/dihydrofolate synthase [Lacibacterium aquatile]|uniref:Dihydrofolate synthase/folylpolyglutamate synthase n=1 Tax=Lacibacterium aquatile TaxID=1168082 RepID=A0ABW5DLK0_9PROT
MALTAAERCAELLERMKALHPRVIDLSLDRMYRVLAALDNPQKRLPPVVHVAGTNGKGSFVAYTRAIFEAAGYKVHAYTSPHLVRFNERIVLGGKTISDDALADALERVELANGAEPITFFEVTTAAAFLAFSQYPADVLLLEVGLGGRLDATNVIDAPLMTAITSVSLDHQHYLGDVLAAIAGEKAGILKQGVPSVVGRQESEAQSVIDLKAASVGSELATLGRQWSVSPCTEGLKYQDENGCLLLPVPALPGPYQYDNAGMAVAAALRLRKKFQRLSALSIAEGMKSARWPARMQRLKSGPLVSLLPASAELWLDGAHNAGAGEALAPMLAEWAGKKPLHVVLGMIDSKDPAGFLRPIAPYISELRTIDVPGEHAAIPAEKLAEIARDLDIKKTARSGSVAEALRELADRADGSRILICGSLYLAGHVLAECHLSTCDDDPVE